MTRFEISFELIGNATTYSFNVTYSYITIKPSLELIELSKGMVSRDIWDAIEFFLRKQKMEDKKVRKDSVITTIVAINEKSHKEETVTLPLNIINACFEIPQVNN